MSLGERLRSLALSARTHLTWSRLRWALATLVVAGIAWLICPRCMTEPTLLYVLSTLAQTCAALAAFVGAVGIFRLQTLRDQRAALEREAIGWAQATSGHYDFSRMPMELVQPSMAGLETAGTIKPSAHLTKYKEALARWKRVPDRIRDSRRALLVFEGWNVAVIAVSLMGFNFMRWLTDAEWAVWVLSLIVAGTAFVTMYCVVVWTRGVET